MSLESRLKDLVSAVGADIKSLRVNTPTVVEYTVATAARPSGAKQVSWVWRGTGTYVAPQNAVFPDLISRP